MCTQTYSMDEKSRFTMQGIIYNRLEKSCIINTVKSTMFHLTMVFYIHPGGVLDRDSNSEDQNRLVVKEGVMANSANPVTSPGPSDVPSSTGILILLLIANFFVII